MKELQDQYLAPIQGDSFLLEGISDATPDGIEGLTIIEYQLYSGICIYIYLQFWIYDDSSTASIALHGSYADLQSTEVFQISEVDFQGYLGYFMIDHPDHRKSWAAEAVIVDNVIVYSTAERRYSETSTHYLGCVAQAIGTGVDVLMRIEDEAELTIWIG